MIAPYDVSLKKAPAAERRRIGELVACQLEERLGSLRDRVFEIHAGGAYVEGLAPALFRRGARLTNPLEGLRIGEQLHWYGDHTAQPSEPVGRTTKPLAASHRHGVEPSAEVAIVASARLLPFTYTWPEGPEAFEHGWDLTVRSNGASVAIRHAIGHHIVYGCDRAHAVTWIAGEPMVEGVATDDYDSTAAMVSLLRIGGKPLVRARVEIPSGYEDFTVVDHSKEIVAPHSKHALAIKLAEDDLVGWARHALLRLRSKLPPAPITVAKSERSSVVEKTVPLGADAHSVAAALLKFAESNAANGVDREPTFTPDPAANHLLITDPFAFLLAVIFDQGIRAERAWAAPHLLRQRLGHLDPARVAAAPELVEAAVRQPPQLQRFVNKVPAWIQAAALRVLRDYGGDAGRIWGDRPPAATLRRRLDAFDGIGQKKAAMAVEILARDLRVPIADLGGSDIAYDVHVRRVFLRAGLAEHDDLREMVRAARALHPERPGALDLPAWIIGRTWCRPGVPRCPECPIAQVCPQIVDAAAGVQGS